MPSPQGCIANMRLMFHLMVTRFDSHLTSNPSSAPIITQKREAPKFGQTKVTS
jgi:hypothetical protein